VASDEKGRPTAVNTLVYAFYGLGALLVVVAVRQLRAATALARSSVDLGTQPLAHLVGIQSGSEGDALEARAVEGPHTLGALHVRDPTLSFAESQDALNAAEPLLCSSNDYR